MVLGGQLTSFNEKDSHRKSKRANIKQALEDGDEKKKNGVPSGNGTAYMESH